ncbi:thiol-disulfide oxidoreductase [Alkalihalophilus pseudofirmus]|nr:thiol-disulfide oxidoreductase [Alkalihalophilus pseudofirmus]
MSGIILFDGDCNFCNQSVQFILKRDRNGYFKFASLQSEIGKSLLEQHGLTHDMNSFVLIKNNQCYQKSSAALHVCRNLNRAWKFIWLFRVIPTSIRDFIYNVIAKNRYRWFGQRGSCMLPSVEDKKRFLD